MKKVLSLVILIVTLFSLSIIPVSAKEVTTITEYLEDGTYFIETVEEETSYGVWAISTKSGTKTRTYYSASGSALFSLTVGGTFNYNGTVARAIDSSYSYGINSSLWSFVSGSSSYTANKATATGTFSSLGNQKTLSVTLACDQDGNLS